MSTATKIYKVGDTLTYRIFDEESYSKGYGIRDDILTSKIREIRFKTDGHTYDIGKDNILSENKTPQVGETITIEFMDGEEGRSYGWFMNKKTCKVTELRFRMENGPTIPEKDIR